MHTPHGQLECPLPNPADYAACTVDISAVHIVLQISQHDMATAEIVERSWSSGSKSRCGGAFYFAHHEKCLMRCVCSPPARFWPRWQPAQTRCTSPGSCAWLTAKPVRTLSSQHRLQKCEAGYMRPRPCCVQDEPVLWCRQAGAVFHVDGR